MICGSMLLLTLLCLEQYTKTSRHYLFYVFDLEIEKSSNQITAFKQHTRKRLSSLLWMRMLSP